MFLLAAQARFTDCLSPAFYEYETSKALRTRRNSWLRVSPLLDQRIVGIPVGLVGLGLLVPNSLNMPSPVKPPQPRVSSALVLLIGPQHPPILGEMERCIGWKIGLVRGIRIDQSGVGEGQGKMENICFSTATHQQNDSILIGRLVVE